MFSDTEKIKTIVTVKQPGMAAVVSGLEEEAKRMASSSFITS